MKKYFTLGKVTGEYYSVIGPAGEHYRNVALCRDDLRDVDGGMTRVYAIITKDATGKVDVAWQHEDPTCGKTSIATYDVGYQENIGFWASVKDHIQMLESGDIPGECLGLGYGWQE